MPGVSVSSSLRHDCPPFLWSIEMSEPTNMANMFWNLDKISETTAIHSGFRLCPIISHSSIRRTIPVAFISKTPFVFQIFQDDSAWQKLVSAGFVWLCRPGGWFHLAINPSPAGTPGPPARRWIPDSWCDRTGDRRPPARRPGSCNSPLRPE